MQPIVLRVGRGENDGQGKANDIIINDSSVSRAHLDVFIDTDGTVFITDLNSTNGTFVNGVQLKGDTMLRKGDVLKLGNSQPIHWEDWRKYGGNDQAASFSSTGAPTSSDAYESLSLPPKKKNKALPYIIGGAVLFVIICCTILLIFQDSFFGPKDPFKGIVFNKSKVESMTYQELQAAVPFHPEVFELSDSDRVTTSDNVSAMLIIKENKLDSVIKSSVEENQESESSTEVNTVTTEEQTKDKKDNSTTQVTLEPDKDKDGVPDAKDKCPDVKGVKNKSGCPDTTTANTTTTTTTTSTTPAKTTTVGGGFKQNPDKSFETTIAAGGETIKKFLNRIKNNGSNNCDNPGDYEEIIIINKSNGKIKPEVYQKMKEDESYVVPAGTTIKFFCH